MSPDPRHARPRPVADFLAAVRLLTLLPAGVRHEGRSPRVTGWFGWVGWLVGGSAAGGVWLLQRYVLLPRPMITLLLAVAVVGAWALVTRAMHWDGIADTADGLWGGATADRRLDIMRDSRIGAFGAVALVFTAMLEVAAVAALIEVGALWVLVVAAVISRVAASTAAWTLPAARSDGLGHSVTSDPGIYDVAAAGLSCLALLIFAPFAPAPFFAIALVGLTAAFAVPRLLAREVGGMTGDLFGATVVLVEVIVVLTGALLT